MSSINDKENLHRLLEERGLIEKYKVDPTTIATDVESPSVGKALGADKFLQFLKDRDIAPEKFETFGDSKSDLEMSDELARRGRKVKMVYVGDHEKLGVVERDYSIDFVGNYSQGTRDYLQRTS